MMLRALRKHRCFYCNQPGPKRKPRETVWHCVHCEADNWLDRNGEITDPPAKVTRASPPTTRSSPLRKPSSLCATCIKHQRLIANSLAAYYPEDGDEAAYEAAEPAYRRRLEQRWPPLCAQCEPRVHETLRRVDYQARADQARRTLDRLRGSRNSPSPRDFLVTIAAIAWYLSWAGDIVGPFLCYPSYQPTCLFLALISLWWHPYLQRRAHRRTLYYILSITAWMFRLLFYRQNWPHKYPLWTSVVNFGTYFALCRIVRPQSQVWIRPIPSAKAESSEGQVHRPTTFTVADLAPRETPVPRLLTPPPEADYEDATAMDWTPTRVFEPRVSGKPRLRSTGHPLDLTSLGLSLDPAGDEDSNDEATETASLATGQSSRSAFATPRFFAQEQDTGLEGLLGASFSLQEEPDEVVKWTQSQASRRRRRDGQRPTPASVKGGPENSNERNSWPSLLVLLIVLGLLVWGNTRSATQMEGQTWHQVLARATREVERVWGRMGL